MECAAGSFPSLVHLELSGCISLPRLLIPAAPRLHRVLVNGCAVLRVVSLGAPQLQEVRAKGCTRLMVRLHLATWPLVQLCGATCVAAGQIARLDSAVLVGRFANCQGVRTRTIHP